MRKTLMAVGACLLFVLTACTKDCLRCVEVYGDEATIYLDDAGSSAEVREAILDADSKGVVSYTVIGSAVKLGMSSNPFADTKVKTLDLSAVTGWPTGIEFEADDNVTISCTFIPKPYFQGNHFPELQDVILPDEVQFICSFAFSGCDNLLGIRGRNVIGIGDSAFSGCGHLVQADFPNVTFVGDNVFYGCSDLKHVEMYGLQNAGNSAFQECGSLADVNFPELEVVSSSMFFKCSALKSVYLPAVGRVESDAFTLCSSLEDINIPEAGYVSGFLGCTSLASLNLPKVTELGIGFGDTPLEWCELPVKGDITVNEWTFDGNPPFASENCVLVLNADKRPGGGCTPVADPETNTWAGVRWKQILFTD